MIADANRPLKVLYLLHDARRSGVPAVAANFIRLAALVGVAPTVLFAYDGVYAAELRAAGIPVLTLGARTPLVWRIKRFLLNGYLLSHWKQFDIIHIHSLKLAWSVIIAKGLGARVIFHLHELPRRIGWVLRQALAAADEVVFCSRTCADHFAGVPVKKGRTIVNAANFSDMLPVVHMKDNNLIVMAASINRNKGQDLLLEAFARLHDLRAELWLYGTVGLSARGYAARLKERVHALGLDDRVHFPGPTSDVLDVFRRAAVVVHTSWTESFGMSLVEAMSCGVPVVAHDLEGMREVVEDGITGYLVPPGDVTALANRLDELLASPGLRIRMGGAGYRLMRERFDISSRLADYADLYRQLKCN